jgi:hypothetical protein
VSTCYTVQSDGECAKPLLEIREGIDLPALQGLRSNKKEDLR